MHGRLPPFQEGIAMGRKRRIVGTALVFATILMWLTYMRVSRTAPFWGDVVAMTAMAGVVGALGGALAGWLRAPWKR